MTYRRQWIGSVLLGLFCTGWAGSASSGEAELARFWELKAIYLEKSAGARTAADTLGKKLLELERKAAAERDYAGAQRFKKERLSLLVGTPAKGGEHNILLATAAVVTGAAKLDAAQALVGFAVGDVVSWELPADLALGAYQVELFYATEAVGGGRLVLKETLHTAALTVKPLSGGTDQFEASACGVLRVREGCRRLEARITEVIGGGLMRLKSVNLLPLHSGS